ncbi:MAG: putative chemoreceptor glutamine deamidase CheD [Candidatus Nitrosocaldaceae archaeon]|nr:MAG: putative chemoreceptor glutamine deamidase CheD [Candidatus Nitrosocaldaceae archaeon]
MSIINIMMGDLKFARKGDILTTFVGSCIACCIYNYDEAAMAHIMLPYSKGRTNSLKGKYADQAIEHILNRLEGNLKAKLAGGAKIFVQEQDNDIFNIGHNNIIAVKDILKTTGINIDGEDLGKNYSRNVSFEVNTSKMIIKCRSGTVII